MPLILDTGPIVAALDRRDKNHQRCQELLGSSDDLLIPSTVLVEVDYWLRKLASPQIWMDLVKDIKRGAYRLISPQGEDLVRAAEFELQYQDLCLGLVDASIMAICERLGETQLATLDLRHFSIVRPRHCPYLTLLPE
ncbi:MAG: type II toxin-antitoxin system VapC family toxin [Candidatus Dormibacteraceae bacterium]